ncbi:50S ribosomal protein L1 [Candidatus Gracilibacteria bacterium]|nr:MAG: 50S ribosomal protein L1 [Candidatus Gracilibacteria bacterium]PIE85065.1 MAG: 50S ribosomal protein L1 [Candidatus Gracilibacteria bacterium]
MARGKKYKKAVEFIKEDMAYSINEAVELLEKTNTVKFDPTVEIHLNLNLDPKYQDQMIRTTITLPNGSGKVPKICAFTDNVSAEELKNAGASIVGDEEYIEDLAKGNVSPDFDICVSTPSMMRNLGKIARILGPKGLMPNPKTGTVGEDLLAVVKEIAAGKFEFKTDKQGNIHSIFGKLSFGKDKLVQNLEHFLNVVNEVKPSGSKGKYINSVYICNSMGPSIKLNMNTEEK